ncbi:MAG: 50S ribosomal protein L6 [Thermodesulfobacteriota bacterium]
MSRIGKKPIPLPKDVKYVVGDGVIEITGPKGKLSRKLIPQVDVVAESSDLVIKGSDDSRQTDAFCGMYRSLVDNMVTGVSKGFKKRLVVEGVGYRASVAGRMLTLNVGFSNPVDFDLPEGVAATIDKNVIQLESIDNELLGQTAAKLRAIRKPEPYKGKGIRYEGERIVRKVGKAAGKKK